jgi:pimeloyl-ACP methyl ester carboxylesterase
MTTFVLVPGAWFGGWAWSRTTPLLEDGGAEAFPVTLTGMGERVHLASEGLTIETAIEDVVNVMEFNDLEDVVLVGHSFAGKVAAAAADRAPKRVKQVLYCDAFRPDKGVRKPQGGFADEFPVEGWKVPFPAKILDTTGKDVQGADREWLLSKATPLPVMYFRDPVTLSSSFDSIGSAYIFCRDGGDPVDEILAGKWGKLDGEYQVIDSGHRPMVTMPEELAGMMLELAE